MVCCWWNTFTWLLCKAEGSEPHERFTKNCRETTFPIFENCAIETVCEVFKKVFKLASKTIKNIAILCCIKSILLFLYVKTANLIFLNFSAACFSNAHDTPTSCMYVSFAIVSVNPKNKFSTVEAALLLPAINAEKSFEPRNHSGHRCQTAFWPAFLGRSDFQEEILTFSVILRDHIAFTSDKPSHLLNKV